jgi:hypothetical protein
VKVIFKKIPKILININIYYKRKKNMTSEKNISSDASAKPSQNYAIIKP